MLTLVIALQLLDLATTLYGLKRGFREGNPLLVKLQGLLGRDGAIIAAKAAFIGLLLYFEASLHPHLLAGIAALYVVVVVRNVRLLTA